MNMNCKTKSFMTKKKAFTLIELLIVIAIIGILFIVLVSKVDFATDKAKAAGVQTDFRSFQLAFDTVATQYAGFDALVDTDYEALEAAINKHLDTSLKIDIDAMGKISMVNGTTDPWKVEYHGEVIFGEDEKDSGAIVMYSNGANMLFGSDALIANGIATIVTTNENGKDDYAIISCYSLANGYGEIVNITTGFGNDQSFLSGGNNGSAINPDNDDFQESKEPGLHNGDQFYSWDEFVNDGNIIVNDNTLTEVSDALSGEFVVSNKITSIGTFAFESNDYLTSVVMYNGIKTIEPSAFKAMAVLEKVEIPSTVTSIGAEAFADCNELKAIIFKGTTDQWNAITKGNNWNANVPATEVICTNGTISLAYVIPSGYTKLNLDRIDGISYVPNLTSLKEYLLSDDATIIYEFKLPGYDTRFADGYVYSISEEYFDSYYYDYYRSSAMGIPVDNSDWGFASYFGLTRYGDTFIIEGSYDDLWNAWSAEASVEDVWRGYENVSWTMFTICNEYYNGDNNPFVEEFELSVYIKGAFNNINTTDFEKLNINKVNGISLVPNIAALRNIYGLSNQTKVRYELNFNNLEEFMDAYCTDSFYGRSFYGINPAYYGENSNRPWQDMGYGSLDDLCNYIGLTTYPGFTRNGDTIIIEGTISSLSALWSNMEGSLTDLWNGWDDGTFFTFAFFTHEKCTWDSTYGCQNCTLHCMPECDFSIYVKTDTSQIEDLGNTWIDENITLPEMPEHHNCLNLSIDDNGYVNTGSQYSVPNLMALINDLHLSDDTKVQYKIEKRTGIWHHDFSILSGSGSRYDVYDDEWDYLGGVDTETAITITYTIGELKSLWLGEAAQTDVLIGYNNNCDTFTVCWGDQDERLPVTCQILSE